MNTMPPVLKSEQRLYMRNTDINTHPRRGFLFAVINIDASISISRFRWWVNLHARVAEAGGIFGICRQSTSATGVGQCHGTKTHTMLATSLPPLLDIFSSLRMSSSRVLLRLSLGLFFMFLMLYRAEKVDRIIVDICQGTFVWCEQYIFTSAENSWHP